MMKKILSLLILLLPIFTLNNVFAVSVELPPISSDEVWGSQVVDTDKDSWIKFIDFVNEYLWFFLGILIMAYLIWAWIELFSAEGREEPLNKANKFIVYLVVWIILSMLSYAMVRVLVNLF